MATKKESEFPEFDEWFSKQDEATQRLINERFTRLENTVKATREERDSFSTELKELGKKLEKGSEAETKIGELSNKLSMAERKSNFLIEAGAQGCLKPNAAYSIANSESFFKEDGSTDWKRVKEFVPELFRPITGKTNAGSGTNTNVVAPENPNDAFRATLEKL